MTKNNILFTIIGLLAGLVIGFMGANSLNREALTQTNSLGMTNPNQAMSNLDHGAKDAPPMQGGMMPDITEKLEKAKNEPNNFEAQMQAGDMYAQIRRFDKAIEFYDAGVKLKPDDFAANIVLANSYFDARQFENAEKYYAKALEINPKDVNARTDLATTLVERQNPDFDRAITEFKKSLEVNPKHEPTLYNLGVAYFRIGDKENAQKMLAQLEQANPDSQLIERMRKAIQ